MQVFFLGIRMNVGSDHAFGASVQSRSEEIQRYLQSVDAKLEELKADFFVKGQDDLPLSLLNRNIYINITALMLQYEKW